MASQETQHQLSDVVKTKDESVTNTTHRVWGAYAVATDIV